MSSFSSLGIVGLVLFLSLELPKCLLQPHMSVSCVLTVKSDTHTSVTLRTVLAEIFFSPDRWDRMDASRINLDTM